MKKLLSLVCAGAAVCLASVVHAQAPTAASGHSRSIMVGVGYSTGQPDYHSLRRVAGASAWGIYDLTTHFSVEADAHLSIISTPDDFNISSYMAGIRYYYPIKRYSPYAKVTGGLGYAKFVAPASNYPPGLYYNQDLGAFFALGFGGGVDVMLSKKWAVRGEYEMQKWSAVPDHGITPNLLTVGVAYRLR